MFQNQKKLRNFLYIFLILFTVFQACKPKYQEEIKPLETTPISALSKKASVWWQNKQSQPKPQKRGGNVAPEIATTFYPDWSKGTTHRLSDNTIKLIVPVYRNTRVKYYYPTLRRAVFTLNPDSTITNGEIIEIITNTDDILTKYETHLFLNTDASNLLDFSGYVFQYDTQYTPTKLQGYANGVALKDPTTLDGAGGSATWDCDDKNGNPSDPSNGNPGNGNPSTGSWIVFIGSGSGSAINPPPPPPSSSLPSTGGGSTTGGGFIGPLPYVPPVNVTPGCGCGSSEGGGNSTPPPRLADIEAGAEVRGGDVLGGASPPSGGGGSSFGGYGSSRRDAGDSRKVNSNPCGDGGGNNSYDAPRMIVDESITSNPKLNEIFEVVKNTQSFNELTSCFRSNNFFFNDPNNPNRIDPEKFTTLVVKAEAFTGDKANANGETKVKLIDGKWCVVIVINTNVLNRPKWDIARTFFHEAFHAKLASMLYRVPRPADAFNESQKKLFERLPANDPYRMVFDSCNTPNAVIPNEGLKSYIDHKLMAQQANRDKMIDYIKDYFGGTVPFPATVTVQEADEMLQMVVCRGIEKRVRELDSTFTPKRIENGFLRMADILPNY